MDCSVRDGYGQLECCWNAVGYADNGRDGLDLGKKLGRAQACCTALVTQCQRYRVVVSRQPDSKSAKTPTDLELSCLLYCRLNLVVHRS